MPLVTRVRRALLSVVLTVLYHALSYTMVQQTLSSVVLAVLYHALSYHGATDLVIGGAHNTEELLQLRHDPLRLRRRPCPVVCKIQCFGRRVKEKLLGRVEELDSVLYLPTSLGGNRQVFGRRLWRVDVEPTAGLLSACKGNDLIIIII